MAESNIIQMHDYEGNNQYPVTLASLVYDEDGETVSKKLALLLDWFEWGDDECTSVKTKYHFWSEKQLSAGGIGEESEGGEGGIGTITGIYVNGVPYNEPDEFGMLTLPNYPTSLEWANIAGRPENLSEFTDDVVAGHYLPLSGGNVASLTIGGNTAIHSGNVGEYAIVQGGELTQSLKIYERLTDLWTIGGNSPYRLTISRSGSWVSPLIEVFNNNNVDSPDSIVVAVAGGDGTINRIEFVQGADTVDNAILRISKDNLQHRGHIILHDGNAYEYAIAVNTSINPATSYNVAGYGYESLGWFWTGAAMIIGANANYRMAFQGRVTTGNTPELAYNYCYNGVWQNWQRLAFTDSNVASATKLATPRTIWGQSFDGTGNVSGMLFDINNQEFIYSAGTWLRVGNGIAKAGLPTYIDGNDVILRYGISTAVGLILNSSGNVGIGTYNPQYNLDVYGSSRIAWNGMTNSVLATPTELKIDSATTSGWARNFSISNNGTTMFAFGAFGEGSSLTYGYAGGTYINPWVTFDSEKTQFNNNIKIGNAILSWDSTNNALKIEGNVYTTGQLSAGGVGTEVQKVFDIVAATTATEANASYTKTLTHNLNTYDLAVVVYEVEDIAQSDGTTEKLTQVLADVTLTDENNVTVYFATRKTNKKYRIVIIG